MKQITLEEFSQNLRNSKSVLLNKLRVKMIAIGLKMERKLKDDKKGAWRRWVNDSGRLAQSIGYNYAIVQGKPAILLQAGGQVRGKDVNYARILEFGSPSRSIKVGKHTVSKHRVSPHTFTRNGTEYKKKGHTRGPMSRGPYTYTRPPIRGRFYLKRTVEWGARQFPKDLQEILTTAIVGGRNG